MMMFLLVVIFVTPNWGGSFHDCDETQDTTFAKPQSPPQETTPAVPHGEDCGCPLHHLGCHHNIAQINPEHSPVLMAPLAKKDFSEINTSIKPGPFLEGPFQPPRS